jgi:hypothetical protein
MIPAIMAATPVPPTVAPTFTKVYPRLCFLAALFCTSEFAQTWFWQSLSALSISATPPMTNPTPAAVAAVPSPKTIQGAGPAPLDRERSWGGAGTGVTATDGEGSLTGCGAAVAGVGACGAAAGAGAGAGAAGVGGCSRANCSLRFRMRRSMISRSGACGARLRYSPRARMASERSPFR